MRIKPSDYLDRSTNEVFEIEMGNGDVYVLPDPKRLRARDLVKIDRVSPEEKLRLILGEDEAEKFLDNEEVDGYFLEEVFSAWLRHYGTGQSGNSNGS